MTFGNTGEVVNDVTGVFDVVNDYIEFKKAGKYRVTARIDVEDAGGNSTSGFMFVGNQTNLVRTSILTLSASWWGTYSFDFIETYAIGDKLDFRATHVSGENHDLRNMDIIVTEVPASEVVLAGMIVPTSTDFGAATTITDGQTNATTTYADVSNGSITLLNIGTYNVSYHLTGSSATAIQGAVARLVNSSNVEVVGSVIQSADTTALVEFAMSQKVQITTTSVNEVYKLQFKNTAVGIATLHNNSTDGNSNVLYQQIPDSTIINVDPTLVTPDLLSRTTVTGITSAAITGAGTPLIFTTVQGVAGIPYDPSTGFFSLTANNTYRLQATFKLTSGNPKMGWCEASSSVALIPGTDLASAGTALTTETVELVYTPTVNMDVKFAATTASALTINTFSGYAFVEQLSMYTITKIDPALLPVSNVGVANGDTLKWSAANSQYEPSEVSSGGLTQKGILPSSITEQGIYLAEGTNAASPIYASTGSLDRVMISSSLSGVGTVISVPVGEYLNGVINETYTTQYTGELVLFIDNEPGKWTVQVVGANATIGLDRVFLHDNQAGSLNTTSGIQVVAITTPNSSVITGDLLDFATDYELLLGITKNVANTGLVISKAGLYSINAQMTFQQKLATASAHARAGVQIIKNSSVILETSTGDLGDGQYSHNNVESTWTGYLSAGDIIEFRKCASEDSKLQAYTVEIEQKSTTETVMAGMLVAKDLDYIRVQLSGNSNTILDGTYNRVPFNLVKDAGQGGIPLNADGTVTLLAGVRYELNAYVRTSTTASVNFWDFTADVELGNFVSNLTSNFQHGSMYTIVQPTVDTKVGIVTAGVKTVEASGTYMIVKSIATKSITKVDPVTLPVDNTGVVNSSILKWSAANSQYEPVTFNKVSFFSASGGQGVGGNMDLNSSSTHTYDPQSLIDVATDTIVIGQAGEYDISLLSVKANASLAAISVNGVTKASSQNIANYAYEDVQLKIVILLAVGDVIAFPVTGGTHYDININVIQLA